MSVSRRALLAAALVGATGGIIGYRKLGGSKRGPAGGALCELHIPKNLPKTSSTSDPSISARQAVRWIMQSGGLPANFELRAGVFTEGGTAYAMTRGGVRYIVNDQAKLNWTPGAPNWQELAILAHEIGHHQAGHTLARKDTPWQRELEADYFAGFTLGRLGADVERATRWTSILSVDGSDSHPPREMRRRAAEFGWRAGRR